MYNRILVALDGTQLSESVLSHVEDLASRENSEVILFTVMPEPKPVVVEGRMVMTADQEWEREKLDAEQYLTKLEWRLRSKGIRVTTAATFGDPAKEIADYARRRDVDLIAMATHGRSGLDRLIHGSVSSAVMRMVPTPLLLMKAA
ncbi:MAG: universal stress protein [Chloroflexi bacterium]|nr:universal stress protein [Chloroflexota bacterium]